MLRIAPLLVLLTALGCSGSSSIATNPDADAQEKVEAMTKIAVAVETQGPNQEFAVLAAIEKYREVPFTPKSQPDATAKILEIYNTRVKPKIKGDAGVQMAGEIALLEKEMK